MYQYTRCHFTENLNIYQQRCENLTCRTPCIVYIAWILFSVAYITFDLDCVTVRISLTYLSLTPGTVVYLRICIECSTDIALVSVQKKQNFICVLRKFFTVKSTRCTDFSNLFLEWNSTCFGQFLCPSSGDFHCTHSNGICHTGLRTACEQDQDGTEFHPDPTHKLSANLYDMYHCCVYSEKLLMMDRTTVRNMQSFIPKINLRNQCI